MQLEQLGALVATSVVSIIIGAALNGWLAGAVRDKNMAVMNSRLERVEKDVQTILENMERRTNARP